jgi:hypothetical protein
LRYFPFFAPLGQHSTDHLADLALFSRPYQSANLNRARNSKRLQAVFFRTLRARSRRAKSEAFAAV